MVEDTTHQSDRVSAAAVLQFAAREARQGRRFAEFGAHAFASITYNACGNLVLNMTLLYYYLYTYILIYHKLLAPSVRPYLLHDK